VKLETPRSKRDMGVGRRYRKYKVAQIMAGLTIVQSSLFAKGPRENFSTRPKKGVFQGSYLGELAKSDKRGNAYAVAVPIIQQR
jgi:hypothetical protein